MTSFCFCPIRFPGAFANRAASIALTSFALIALGADCARAANGWVTVELADGRRVSGQIDPASDERFLWLVGRAEGVELRSRYDRRDVVAIVFQSSDPSDSENLSVPSQSSSPAGWESPRGDLPMPRMPVQSVQVYAEVANWDSDAPIDGLLVTIAPLDAFGRLTPVRGSVDLTLIGEVWPRGVRPDAGLRPGFQELERTSHLLDESDFADGPAVVRLPLRHVNPDFDVQIATYGIVHARLGVPGQGAFDASDSFVRLRPASPPRDRLQLFSGQRFFPSEHVTGRR